VAGGAVGEEHAAGFVPGRGQQPFAFGDEPVGAAGVAEVEECLAGVHGEIGLGQPGAPCGPVGAGGVEVVFCGGQGAQGGASFALCGVGAGQAQLEEAAGGWVVGAGECVGEEVLGEGGVVLPGGLVGEVADEAGAAVGGVGGVAVVEGGDLVLGGVGVMAEVEAAPGEGLGEVGGQVVEAVSGGRGVAAVVEEVGDGGL
jgi:hypothetical protein